VPRPYQDNPEAVFAVLWTAQQLGIAPSLLVLKKFDVIEGSVEPRAQTLAGLLMGQGHFFRMVMEECDEHHAVAETRRAGEDELRRFEFSIAMVPSDRLNEWVEHRVKTGERWPSGDDKYRTERYVIGSTDSPPEWAAAEIKAGHLHRSEAWYEHRQEMLMNRVAKLAARWTAPDLELALEATPPELAPADTPAEPVPQAALPPRPKQEPAISDDDRATLLRRLDALRERAPDTHRLLQTQWIEDLGGPNIRTGVVTRIHAWALGRMVDDVVELEASDRGGGSSTPPGNGNEGGHAGPTQPAATPPADPSTHIDPGRLPTPEGSAVRPDEVIPSDVHDRAPEASAHGMDEPEAYEQGDLGEPF
jgi:hypothetical protein